MSSDATVCIVGNVGRDVELKPMKNGGNLTRFSVAVSTFKNSTEGTEWYSVTCFQNLEKKALRCTKGTKVLVRGELTHNESNGKVYNEILAEGLNILFKARTDATAPTPQKEPVYDADVPF